MPAQLPSVDEVKKLYDDWVESGRQPIGRFARERGKDQATVRRWLNTYAVNMGVTGEDARVLDAPKEPEGRTHCVIPDVQAKDGVPLDHLEWAGKYIAEKKPDVIICIGDFSDMASLSHYNSKRRAEGMRYKKDVEAARRAMRLLMTPIMNEPGYKPKKIMIPGNHEDMINRHIQENPLLEGTISVSDLGYEEWGWEVQPYLKPIKIDGIAYAHYFYNPNTGKPYGGANLETRLKTIGMSFTMGHQQGLKVAIRDIADGTRQRGLVAGSFYQHTEDYKGPQGNGHWQGLIMKHEVCNGNYDLLEVSLGYLKRRYGNIKLKDAA